MSATASTASTYQTTKQRAPFLVQKPQLAIFDEPTRRHRYPRDLGDIDAVGVISPLPEIVNLSNHTLVCHQGRMAEPLSPLGAPVGSAERRVKLRRLAKRRNPRPGLGVF
jgi:hypothetical protein